MIVPIAFLCLVAMTWGWADGTTTSSSKSVTGNGQASGSTPLPELQDKSATNGLQELKANNDHSVSASDLQGSLFEVNPQQSPELSKLDKDKQDKAEADKNWLFNAIREKRTNEALGINQSPYDLLRAQTLKTLSKAADKDDLSKAGSMGDSLMISDKVKIEGKENLAATKPNALTLDQATDYSPSGKSTPLAGSLTKFQPTLSGLSLETTSPVSESADKVYTDAVSSMIPIQGFDNSTLTAFTVEALTPINAVTNPINQNFADAGPSSSGIAPLAQISENSISITPIQPVAQITPIAPLNTAPPNPIQAPHSPSPTTSSAYKPKVADPSDFLK